MRDNEQFKVNVYFNDLAIYKMIEFDVKCDTCSHLSLSKILHIVYRLTHKCV